MIQARKLGQWAEAEALKISLAAGYALVHANYHSRYGEIDLIVQKDLDLVFIEVKARSQTRYAQASETVSRSKQRKLMQTALIFLQQAPQYSACYCRFDVICFDFYQHFAKSIQYDFSKCPYDQQWIENAFTFEQEFITL